MFEKCFMFFWISWVLLIILAAMKIGIIIILINWCNIQFQNFKLKSKILNQFHWAEKLLFLNFRTFYQFLSQITFRNYEEARQNDNLNLIKKTNTKTRMSRAGSQWNAFFIFSKSSLKRMKIKKTERRKKKKRECGGGGEWVNKMKSDSRFRKISFSGKYGSGKN